MDLLWMEEASEIFGGFFISGTSHASCWSCSGINAAAGARLAHDHLA